MNAGSRGFQLFAAWGWATIYACTDEIHQLFVPGRGGSIIDVLNDSMGALVSVLFCLLVAKLVEKHRMVKASKI